MRHSPIRSLAVLLVAFIVLGVTDALLTPLFENPDESSHLQVIRYFAEERRLYAPVMPVLRVATGPEMAESLRPQTPPRYYTPPFYHAIAALLTGGIEMRDLNSRLIPNPAWDEGWSPQRNADPWNKNVYVHLPGETWADSPTFRVTLLLRLTSVGLGALTVLCTYHIARLIRPDNGVFALGAAAVVGLNPQFIALSAGVPNDPLLIAIFSATLLLALRWMQTGAPWTRWARLGALVGTGLLTKQSALLLLPLVGLAILWQGGAHRSWRKVIRDGFAFGLAALLVGGWWYAYNAIAFDDPLGMRVHFESQVALRSFGLREVIAIFETYWAGFGWALLSAPGWVYWIIAGIAALSLAGILRSLLPGGDFHRLTLAQRRSLVVLTIAVTLNALSLVRWAIATGAPYGRLLFPGAAVIGVLLAWGLAQWRDTPGARGARATLAVTAVLFAALTPWTILRPAFATPILSGPLPKGIVPVNATFDDVTLLGYAAPARDQRPGDALPITLYWRATSVPDKRYTTFVQLSPQDPTQRVAEDVRWLGGTLYPSDFWQAGDTIYQKHTLRIPDDTPAPGLYWIRLGLVDAEGTRVAVHDGEDTVTLGPWRVRDTDSAPKPQHRVTYTLGDAIALCGYDVHLDETLTVTLTWAAKATPSQDYNVFVHALDETGNIIAQHDGPPVEGRCPTMWWLPGESVRDPHILPLPANATHLRVGMYDPRTLTRLPAYDDNGARLPDDAILLPLLHTP